MCVVRGSSQIFSGFYSAARLAPWCVENLSPNHQSTDLPSGIFFNFTEPPESIIVGARRKVRRFRHENLYGDELSEQSLLARTSRTVGNGGTAEKIGERKENSPAPPNCRV